MVSSAATTVDQYLAALPADRRAAISRVRDVVNANLPEGFQEGMQYGMISWFVPLARLADTYNGQPAALASLASQKQYMALYLMTVYGDRPTEKWFRSAFAAAGKKLDMGKSCVRFKTIDALPLDVIGQAIARVSIDKYVARIEALRPKSKRKPTKKPMKKLVPKAKKPPAKKPRSRR
ncbi:MAG TPA: DUF1801 domain-containing protein [Kofleriaceae bacterium]